MAAAPTDSYTLTVEGVGDPVPAPADRTVLESLRAAGLTVRSGCKAGACRTCALRLVSGKIRMASGTSLPDETLRSGIFLACVTWPASDLVVALPKDGPLVPILPWAE